MTTVLIAGDGIVALAAARALARHGVSVRLVGRRLPGAASPAAAGLLAPSLGDTPPAARSALFTARDMLPEYAARLERETGHALPVDSRGILQVALDEVEWETLRRSAPAWAEPVDRAALPRMEPSLVAARGALFHPRDGAIDNRALLAALEAACGALPNVVRVAALATHVELGSATVALHADDGSVHHGDALVVAAGAWAAGIAGLPRAVPVAPARGQMLALARVSLDHCLTGAGCYVVPRADRALVGSTMEHVGFEVATTDEAIARLRASAARLVPALAGARELERWAGLRPMSPDGLPIVGRDPDAPTVFYACGLSKNGILAGPAIGEAIAAAVTGDRPTIDLAPFAATRFASADAALQG